MNRFQASEGDSKPPETVDYAKAADRLSTFIREGSAICLLAGINHEDV